MRSLCSARALKVLAKPCSTRLPRACCGARLPDGWLSTKIKHSLLLLLDCSHLSHSFFSDGMPHIPPTIELLEHAQLQYRRKDYVKALDLLNLAIKHEPAPSVKLLDTRAAVHEKLEDYKAALADARTCIRIFEKDSTGYLRAGKVLQLMSKPDVALAIYRRGFVKKANNADLLHDMHRKLEQSLAFENPKDKDPFAQLPIEIVEMIISYLNFRQIVYCTRVSKQWKTLIHGLPGLWTNLDFSEAVRPVPSAFLTHCINNSRHKIVSATLKRIKNMEKVIRALAQSCPQFETFQIIDGGLQGSSLVHELSSAKKVKKLMLGPFAPISAMTLPDLLLACESLQELDCRAVLSGSSVMAPRWRGEFPALRSLTLSRESSSSSQHSSIDLRDLLMRAPNLECFIFINWSLPGFLFKFKVLKHLIELNITSVSSSPSLLPFANLPRSLQVLTLDMNRPIRNVVLPGPADVLLPNLRSLTCCGAKIASLLLSDPSLSSEYSSPEDKECFRHSNLSRLHTLHVQCTGGAESVTSLLALPRLEHLRSLQLTHNSTINDEVAEYIATHMKHLQHVDLSSTMITGAGVKALVDGLRPTLRSLKFVNVWHCSPDASEWARSQGIRVQYSQNADIKPKGRKVRYE